MSIIGNMPPTYDDGLQAVTHDVSIYTSLSQLHAPDRSPSAAPQVYKTNSDSNHISEGLDGMGTRHEPTQKQSFKTKTINVIIAAMLTLSIITALATGLGISLSRYNSYRIAL